MVNAEVGLMSQGVQVLEVSSSQVDEMTKRISVQRDKKTHASPSREASRLALASILSKVSTETEARSDSAKVTEGRKMTEHCYSGCLHSIVYNLQMYRKESQTSSSAQISCN